MKTKTLFTTTALAIGIILFAANAFANIPAPPVNQILAMPDTVMNELVEAECRACHEDNPVDSTSIPDRHHLLYGSPIIYGQCANDALDPPCLTNADCAPEDHCTGETAASDPYANADLISGVYGCMSCHEESTIGNVTNFLVERDCLVCHAQVGGEASVHHLTGTAQGTDSPLGDPLIGDCTPCHGTYVDDYGDNATIPTYSPSMVTPTVRAGTADEQNIEGARAGGCNYCHSSGTGGTWWDYVPGVDDEFGYDVYKNGTLHHTAGVSENRYGDSVNGGCELCHGNPINTGGDTLALRNCEQCHGMESLHNIQTNAEGCETCDVGGEEYGYGHVGIDNPIPRTTCSDDGSACSSDADCTGEGAICVASRASDCWGCHGFGFSSSAAPASGPTTPSIGSSSDLVIVAGTDTTITLTGASFINTIGDVEYSSNVLLTSQAGVVTELIPESIDPCDLTIVIPGTTSPGNYMMTAVKNNGQAVSNPQPISIKPPADISNATMSASCGTPCTGEVTITGSGFGDAPPAGTEEYINVTQGENTLTIVTWTDTLITATGAVCDGTPIKVNGLYGSAITTIE